MKLEEFEIINRYPVQKGYALRYYLQIKCTEGHLWDIRADTLTEGKTCKFCAAHYYKTKEYNILDGMKQRCYSKNNSKYPNYGARGIKVCERWLEKGYLGVRNFIEDMGKCPENLTIDRINVDGDYCKENCRWASNSMQGFNQTKRSTNKSGRTGVYYHRNKWCARITVNEKEMTLGRFYTFEEAVKAREEAELKYFGFIKK